MRVPLVVGRVVDKFKECAIPKRERASAPPQVPERPKQLVVNPPLDYLSSLGVDFMGLHLADVVEEDEFLPSLPCFCGSYQCFI